MRIACTEDDIIGYFINCYFENKEENVSLILSFETWVKYGLVCLITITCEVVRNLVCDTGV